MVRSLRLHGSLSVSLPLPPVLAFLVEGLSLSSCEPIREAHNSFHRRLAFEIESGKQDKEDAFHFVTFIWHGGKVQIKAYIIFEQLAAQSGIRACPQLCKVARRHTHAE